MFVCNQYAELIPRLGRGSCLIIILKLCMKFYNIQYIQCKGEQNGRK